MSCCGDIHVLWDGMRVRCCRCRPVLHEKTRTKERVKFTWEQSYNGKVK